MARSEADRKAKAKNEPMGRGKGATKTFGKQHGRPDKAEADRYDERSDGWSYGKPAGRPSGKPGGRPTGKPGGRPFGKPSGPTSSGFPVSNV